MLLRNHARVLLIVAAGVMVAAQEPVKPKLTPSIMTATK